MDSENNAVSTLFLYHTWTKQKQQQKTWPGIDQNGYITPMHPYLFVPLFGWWPKTMHCIRCYIILVEQFYNHVSIKTLLDYWQSHFDDRRKSDQYTQTFTFGKSTQRKRDDIFWNVKGKTLPN